MTNGVRQLQTNVFRIDQLKAESEEKNNILKDCQESSKILQDLIKQEEQSICKNKNQKKQQLQILLDMQQKKKDIEEYAKEKIASQKAIIDRHNLEIAAKKDYMEKLKQVKSVFLRLKTTFQTVYDFSICVYVDNSSPMLILLNCW